jgi:hypothetical protein
MFDARIGRFAAYVSTKEAVPYGIVSDFTVGQPRRGERFMIGAWVKAADRPKQVAVRLVEVGGQSAPTFAAEALRRIPKRWRFVSAVGRVRRGDRAALQVSIAVEHSVASGDGIFVDGVRVRRMLHR